jgi:hypothetical protein
MCCLLPVRKQVDQVAEVLEDMLQDISRELFVSDAVADITRAPWELSLHATSCFLPCAWQTCVCSRRACAAQATSRR